MTTALSAKSNGTQAALLVNSVESFSFDSSGVDSPFVVTASVASNALFITVRKGGWRFRSTTLTDGVPVYVKSDTDLTLTVAATDSFGAVTAAGTQRIAVLVVNNAGTLQLAASNLAGGVQLDETNRITTATTATTATAIDSTSVATNVTYRVAGFVDVPFTTGTGYGTIVEVQSIGGKALDSFQSLGYGQTYQNFFGSRASGTTYYNTTGRPITILATAANGASSSGGWTMRVNGAVVGYASIFGGSNNVTTSLVVPPGSSYSMTLFGSASYADWYELR